MNRYIFIPILLFFVLPSFSQKLTYTNNRLYSSGEYRYDIVGEVNNKIIVWESIEVFKIDTGNAISWTNTITGSSSGNTSTNLNNATIVAGDKAVH